MRQGFYFSTRDLVTIAILSALGGVLSTYIGYLGNLVNTTLGVPFGAGQMMAGLHVFWMVVAYAIVDKFGTGSLVGLLKGTVELFAGSTHGLPIVFVSLIEGLLIDLTLTAFRKKSVPVYCLAGALSSMSNVFTFQILYFSSVPIAYILLIASMAALSGAVFAGYFGIGSYSILVQSNIVKSPDKPPSVRRMSIQKVVTILFVIAFVAGGAIYYTVVFKPFVNPETCELVGDVENSYTYRPQDFAAYSVTIRAELKGEYTYVPPKNYTGVPLPDILDKAQPAPGAETVRVIARDGYQAVFNLTRVLADERLILIVEDGYLRLVAADYEGAYWVEQVSEIRVE
jgi:energy-coupling factor transport system substrate-specific component